MNHKELLAKRGDFTLEEIDQYKDQIIEAFKKKGAIKEGHSIQYKYWKQDSKNKQYDFGELNENQLGVEVVANMAMFMDSDNDVLLASSWAQTVEQKGTMIKFQHDHKYTTEATIGDTIGFENREINLDDLGYPGKTGVGLVHIAVVQKEYNPGIFAKYKNGNIQQHSIGMRYRKIELASNREDKEDEYKLWTRFKDSIINFEKAEEKRYFWLIREIELFENSAVLFGANALTPTLSIQSSGADTGGEKGKTESPEGTPKTKYSNLVKTLAKTNGKIKH